MGHNTGNRPLRVAVVGIGSAATRAHLPALDAAAPAVELVGVCDPDPGRRRAVAAAHPGARDFDDNVRMLTEVAPDLLVIATPPSAHLDEITAAMTRGVHVLCEKPLGLRDADVATLHELVTAHPELALATVHQYRHAPAWTWLARAAAGAVRDREPFTLRVRVERPGTDPLSAGGWRSDPEREGGILGDHVVHYLSLLCSLEPAADVTACRCDGPGGRERAAVDVRLGRDGSAHVEASYSGESRRNLIELDRPAQCLRVRWDGDTVQLSHSDRPGPARRVQSLSDRAFVNALYGPMYDGVIRGLSDPRWRRRETDHTVGVAAMLATALSLGASGDGAIDA